MKALIASIATALVFTASSWSSGLSFLAPQYQQTQAQLTPACGSARAYVIAALHEDVDIHKTWADIVTDHPAQAQLMGNVHWHRNWIQIYQRAITLLQEDCRG